MYQRKYMPIDSKLIHPLEASRRAKTTTQSASTESLSGAKNRAHGTSRGSNGRDEEGLARVTKGTIDGQGRIVDGQIQELVARKNLA